LEASKSHYVLTEKVKMREAAAVDAPLVCEMDVGEVFEAIEVPKKQKSKGPSVVRVRALEDSAIGWVVISKPSPLHPWRPKYICRIPVPLTVSLAAKGSTILRFAEVGEILEALDKPIWDTTSSSRRMYARCMSAHNGLACWVTLRGENAEAFLEVVR